MRISKHGDTGYTMWLGAWDTDNWAHTPGAAWPCSTLARKRVMVCVDSNGLCDLTVNGKDAPDDIDGNELGAIVSDHLPDDLKHLWPRWEF